MKISNRLEKQYDANNKIVVGIEIKIKKGLISQYTKDPNTFVTCTVTKVLDDDKVLIADSQGTYEVLKSDCIISNFKIGYNPIQAEQYTVSFLNTTIDGLLNQCGYNRDGEKTTGLFEEIKINGVAVPEITFDPYVVVDGKKRPYQRPLVWTLEQKQNLLDAIYNNVSIGTFCIRDRAYKTIEKEITSGNTEVAFKECVDGKQRLNAILSFLQNEYPDNAGYYWTDFSEQARRKFCSFGKLSLGIIGEDAKAQDILNIFLAINHLGEPQSAEHIQSIKDLKNKL